MSKSLLWILGIIMAVVMICLIIAQAYWIIHAYRIKEQQFSQLVGRALTDISKEIERREAVSYIMNEFSPIDQLWQYNNVDFGYQFDASANFDFDPETGKFKINQELLITNKDGDIRRLFISDHDTGLIHFSGFDEFMDSLGLQNIPEGPVSKETMEIEKVFNAKRALLEQIFTKMISPPPSLEERINIEGLSDLLRKEFLHRELSIDFEYSIIKADNKKVGGSPGFKPRKGNEMYSVTLFPEDLFSLPNYLVVYFPSQRNFIFRSVGLISISSIFLTLIIISIFIFTLYIILKQKKLSEMKNDFVNNMTHELKTPISTISLASQMLNDSNISVENKNFSNISRIIENESTRLGYQVEKVLQMAILDKGKISLKLKKMNVHDLLHSVCSNFEIQVEKMEGELNTLYKAENPNVDVDEVHFTNVMSNLLDNAVKYCREKPVITIGTKNEKQNLVIYVEDKGIGISKENQNRIFEKFYRVHSGNLHNVKGFGLGLSYVKRIVEMHEGHIKIKSELNKGSYFGIYLPLHK